MEKDKFKSPPYLNLQPFKVGVMDCLSTRAPELYEIEQRPSEAELEIIKSTYIYESLRTLREFARAQISLSFAILDIDHFNCPSQFTLK